MAAATTATDRPITLLFAMGAVRALTQLGKKISRLRKRE